MSWGLPLCILVNKPFGLSMGEPGDKIELRYVSPLLLLGMFPTYVASLHGTTKFLQNRYSFRDKECVCAHVCLCACVCTYVCVCLQRVSCPWSLSEDRQSNLPDAQVHAHRNASGASDVCATRGARCWAYDSTVFNLTNHIGLDSKPLFLLLQYVPQIRHISPWCAGSAKIHMPPVV